MNPARYYEVTREIEAILNDITLPRHLQVSFIIDLFDPQGSVNMVDFWPDDGPTSTEAEASGIEESSRPKKRPARKKKAKATKRRG